MRFDRAPDAIAPVPRRVPDTWDDRQLDAFVEIASRCHQEKMAGFTLCALGVMAYVEAFTLKQAAGRSLANANGRFPIEL